MAITKVDFGTFETGGTGSTAWGNPSNAASSDASYTTSSLMISDNSQELRCTNSDLSIIQLSGRVVSVKALVKAKEGAATGQLFELYAFDGTNRVGNNQIVTAQELTDSDVVYTLGTGEWGIWTIDKLLNTSYGISIRAKRITAQTISINHVQLLVEWNGPTQFGRGRPGRSRGR